MSVESMLLEMFTCDLQTGKLYWKKSPGRKVRVGQEAGCARKDGRVVVGAQGHKLYRYRAVWFFATGSLPNDQIDHIDRNPSNDAYHNLRVVTNEGNSWNKGLNSNNTSGIKGVWRNARSGKWVAQITVDGKTCYLGTFSNKDSAAQARAAAERAHVATVLNC